jgi:hypothetical protein
VSLCADAWRARLVRPAPWITVLPSGSTRHRSLVAGRHHPSNAEVDATAVWELDEVVNVARDGRDLQDVLRAIWNLIREPGITMRHGTHSTQQVTAGEREWPSAVARGQLLSPQSTATPHTSTGMSACEQTMLSADARMGAGSDVGTAGSDVGTTMKTPQLYRAQAEICVRQAECAKTPHHRLFLLQMAQTWLRMADEADSILMSEYIDKAS